MARELESGGLAAQDLYEGAAVFRYPSPQAVLDHLLKESNEGKPDYEVSHDFVACVALKPAESKSAVGGSEPLSR